MNYRSENREGKFKFLRYIKIYGLFFVLVACILIVIESVFFPSHGSETIDTFMGALMICIPMLLSLIYLSISYYINQKNVLVDTENTIDESISNYEILEEIKNELVFGINEKINKVIEQENTAFRSGIQPPSETLMYVNNTISNFPELSTNESIMRASKEINDKIIELRNQKMYINSNIKEYNNSIKFFPNSLLFKKLEKKQYI